LVPGRHVTPGLSAWGKAIAKRPSDLGDSFGAQRTRAAATMSILMPRAHSGFRRPPRWRRHLKTLELAAHDRTTSRHQRRPRVGCLRAGLAEQAAATASRSSPGPVPFRLPQILFEDAPGISRTGLLLDGPRPAEERGVLFAFRGTNMFVSAGRSP
jgi:hypothetical protein